jgi:hypothetical protein
MTQNIIEYLQPAELYESYRVKPVNLKGQSKCPTPPTVNIVNEETREDDYVYLNYNEYKRTINRRKLMNAVVEYLKDGFQKSNIIIDPNSSKIIKVSLSDAKASSADATGWVWNADIKIKVDIPEINYSSIFEAKDRAHMGADMRAMAYASHVLSRQIIDDPLIQDYILCKNNVASKSQPSTPDKPKIIKSVIPATEINIIIVTGTSANIRSGAGNKYPIVATVKQGDKLILLGEHREWLNIRLENGQEGWILSRFVQEQ